jgi:hypothetical protein
VDSRIYQVYGGLQDNPGAATATIPAASPSALENMFLGDGFWTFSGRPIRIASTPRPRVHGLGQPKDRAIRLIQPQSDTTETALELEPPIHLSATHKGTFTSKPVPVPIQRRRAELARFPGSDHQRQQKQKRENPAALRWTTRLPRIHDHHSISESPVDASVIWAGTDDGNLQLSRDGGQTWNNMIRNVKGLPANSWVSWVEASRHSASTAYATFDRHTFGDMDPHVFKTTDYGRSWTRIAGKAQGLRGYAHVIREDSVSPSILFVGTEYGLWMTIDGGAQWAQFKGGNFPNVAVRDLVVQARDNDLVIATHGRGIWIIDDIHP